MQGGYFIIGAQKINEVILNLFNPERIVTQTSNGTSAKYEEQEVFICRIAGNLLVKD